MKKHSYFNKDIGKVHSSASIVGYKSKAKAGFGEAPRARAHG